jgi:CHRD domain
MRANLLSIGLAGVTLGAFALAASPAVAENVSFKAALNASSEVPPNSSKGTGSADVTYDTVGKKLTWTVTFSGLTGNATMAHFHGPAEAGKNAGVAVPIPGTASPMAGSATLTDAQAADLMAGKWYVNVHTADNKGGEIRGQLSKGK